MNKSCEKNYLARLQRYLKEKYLVMCFYSLGATALRKGLIV
jgi:hypothetical protein